MMQDRYRASLAALLTAIVVSHASPVAAQIGGPKPAAGAKPKTPEKPAEPPPAAPPPAPETPPPPPPESPEVQCAKERKVEGDKAMDKLRHADAVAAYTESYALKPEPALLYNLGRALEALDRLPEALEKLKKFRDVAPPELLEKVPGLNVRIATLEKKIATLAVKVDVTGARIIVRDAIAGQSPLEKPLELKAGKASVLVEAEGFFPWHTSVDLPGGGAQTVDAKLSSKAKNGKLFVEAPKTAVRVSIDGKNVGQAPLETLLPPGNHKILAQHADHTDYETSVVVNVGETRTVTVVLGPPPIYRRWWFWTSLGAVVLGATATTIVVLSERAPDVGTIEPGNLTPSVFVTAPAIRF